MRIEMRNVPIILCGCALLGALAPIGIAHFRLLEPASWIEEGQLGDPQWLAPCGGTTADPGKPTGAVTKVQGGEKLHVRIREMAFHPGFYRVALAVNSRDELPKDPEPWTEWSGTVEKSISGAIHYPPAPPVLADGLFLHSAPLDNDEETDVLIPNINCSKCTLQVVEFMADHARNTQGDFSYHHCAELQIRANPSKPIDTRFPAEKK
jgi:hypothetical protein